MNRLTAWGGILAAWLLCEVVFSSVSARRYPHYAQLLLVPVALLVGVVFASYKPSLVAGAQASDRSRGFSTAVCVALGCTLAVLPIVRIELGLVSFTKPMREYARRLAVRLQQEGASRDGVFVWGGPPSLYLFLNTAAPVRHIAPSTLATPGFSKREYFVETISCLAGSAPLLISDSFDGTTIGFVRGSAVAPTMVEVPEFEILRNFVKRNYRYEGRVDGSGTALWRRRVTPQFMRDSNDVVARDCRLHVGYWHLHKNA